MSIRSRRLVAILGLAVLLSSSPAFAGPRDDDSPFFRRIAQVVNYIKHLLPVAPTDDPVLPKP